MLKNKWIVYWIEDNLLTVERFNTLALAKAKAKKVSGQISYDEEGYL